MMRNKLASAWRAGRRGARRHWIAITVPLAVLVILAYTIAFLMDEPLRRYTETKVNRALKGYTARIDVLDFHPFGFSLDLEGVTVTQDEHPDPSVLRIAKLSASVHWRALLHGQLVADIEIDQPTVYLNLPQVQKEIADPVPVEKRGWQEALEAIYPLKLNHFEIRNGDVTYIDQGPFKPLRLRDINLVATNIRNVRSGDRVYPSEVRMAAVAFDSGRVAVDGNADFMAAPHPTFRGNVDLASIELDYFKPITNRYNLRVDKGVLSTSGAVEYGREVKTVQIKHATVQGIEADYVHTARTDAVERKRASQATSAAKEVSNKPGVLVAIDELHIIKSAVGFVNKAVTPSYRVFMTDTNGVLRNLTNHEMEGKAEAKLRGRFMGSGPAVAEATFEAEKSGPAFDIAVRIEDVDVTTLNDLLRAYGRFDAAAGWFALFIELSAKDRAITGYVKPLFKDLKVYASEQEKGKPLLRKVYERVVSGAAKILKNRPRDEVATRGEVKGRIDNPQVGVIEVIVNLVQNAFFEAILPGFDAEVGRSERVRRAGSR